MNIWKNETSTDPCNCRHCHHSYDSKYQTWYLCYKCMDKKCEKCYKREGMTCCNDPDLWVRKIGPKKKKKVSRMVNRRMVQGQIKKMVCKTIMESMSNWQTIMRLQRRKMIRRTPKSQNKKQKERKQKK